MKILFIVSILTITEIEWRYYQDRIKYNKKLLSIVQKSKKKLLHYFLLLYTDIILQI